jgi:protein-disulfide isomerase
MPPSWASTSSASSKDLETHRHVPRIREDLASGARSGVNGTPTFFVNGARHEGAYDAASLIAALTNTAPVPR